MATAKKAGVDTKEQEDLSAAKKEGSLKSEMKESRAAET